MSDNNLFAEINPSEEATVSGGCGYGWHRPYKKPSYASASASASAQAYGGGYAQASASASAQAYGNGQAFASANAFASAG